MPLKPNSRIVRRCGMAGIGMLFGCTAQAASLTWDASTGTSGPQDGGGAWDTTSSSWWNGTADIKWTAGSANTAVFGSGSGTAGTVTVAAGGVTAGGIVFNAAASGNYTLSGGGITLSGTDPTILAWRDATINSPLTVSTGILVKDGNGTVTLGAACSSSQATVIYGGTLKLGVDNAIARNPSSANSLLIMLPFYGDSGTTQAPVLDLNGHNLAVNAIHSYVMPDDFSGVTNGAAGAATLTVGSDVTEFTSPFYGEKLVPTFGGIIRDGTGTVAVVKTGSNRQILDAVNGYSGGTRLDGGILAFSSGGLGSGAVTFNGGTLQWYGVNTQDMSAQFAPVAAGQTARLDTASNDVALNSAVTGEGGLTKSGFSALTLNAANSFSGDTRVAEGTLVLGNANALQNSTLDMNTEDAGDVGFGTLSAATLGGLSGSRDLALANASAGAVAVSVGGNGASTQYDGILSGAGSLVKAGNGALTLTGANTYIGATTVSAGTLELAAGGSINESSGITLNGGTLSCNSYTALTAPLTLTGGTLKGGGTIVNAAALVIGAGVTIAPGNSSGMLATGSQEWNGGGTYQWEMDAVSGTGPQDGTGLQGVTPGFDFLAIVGELTLNATALNKFVIDITGIGSVAGWDPSATYSWTVVTADTLHNFDVNAFLLKTDKFTDNNAMAANGFSLGQSGNSIVLNYVPEPGTAGLLALGALAILGRRRRR